MLGGDSLFNILHNIKGGRKTHLIFVYDDTTKEIKAFYGGSLSQINNYSDKDETWKEVYFPDNKIVLQSPYDYRLVFVDDKPIFYAKKPIAIISLSKQYIENDGIDSSIVSIEIINTHALDHITSVNIKVCSQIYAVAINDNKGSVEITSIVEGFFEISVASQLIKSNSVILEVV